MQVTNKPSLHISNSKSFNWSSFWYAIYNLTYADLCSLRPRFMVAGSLLRPISKLMWEQQFTRLLVADSIDCYVARRTNDAYERVLCVYLASVNIYLWHKDRNPKLSSRQPNRSKQSMTHTSPKISALVSTVVMSVNSHTQFCVGVFDGPDRQPFQTLVFRDVQYGNGFPSSKLFRFL